MQTMGTPKQPEIDERSYVPEAVAGTVAAAPLLALAKRGRSKRDFSNPKTPMYSDSSELVKHMQPGDVMVGGYEMGSPAIVDKYFSGNPLYHAEVVTDVDAEGPRSLYGGNEPGTAASDVLKRAPKASVKEYTDAYILRPKAPVDADKLRRSMADSATQPYDLGGAVKGTVLDAFVPPNPLTGKIPAPKCRGSYCASGVAQGIEDATGARVNPNKPNFMTDTGDLLRSDAFEPVASYSDPDTGFLRKNPTGELPLRKQLAARAALGLGVAAPLYAAMNNPLAGVAGAVAAPALLYGARKGFRKLSPRTADRVADGVDTLFAKHAPESVQDLRNVINFSGDERLKAIVPAALGGTTAGALAPSLWSSKEKTAAMDLHFDSPQDIQDHQRTRQRVGAVGALAGGAAGGLLGGKLKGVPGGLIGGLAGGALGNWMGKTTADVAHDVPQRTMHQLHSTVNTLDQAGGSGIRIASVLPSASDFAQLAQEFEEGDGGPPVDSDEQMLDKRLRSPHWGPTTPMEGGDATNLNVTMGVPAYGGV